MLAAAILFKAQNEPLLARRRAEGIDHSQQRSGVRGSKGHRPTALAARSLIAVAHGRRSWHRAEKSGSNFDWGTSDPPRALSDAGPNGREQIVGWYRLSCAYSRPIVVKVLAPRARTALVPRRPRGLLASARQAGCLGSRLCRPAKGVQGDCQPPDRRPMTESSCRVPWQGKSARKELRRNLGRPRGTTDGDHLLHHFIDEW